MDYNKPGKLRANEEYLRKAGIVKGNPYREGQFELQKTFLIVCEGKNTEPLYFKGFPVPSKTVLIEGACNSKLALVDFALDIRKREAYEGRETWCVFDYDANPKEAATQQNDFNSAIEKAEKNGMRVAWSNDAFELWFVLHYQDITVPLFRKDLYRILKWRWGLKSFGKEAKTWDFCRDHYSRHGGYRSEMQKQAISRAKRLHDSYGLGRDFSKQSPCTTVYLLVGELNKFVRQ